MPEQLNLWLTLTSPRRPAASLQTGGTDFNRWEANLACLKAAAMLLAAPR